jgi:AcrR family transcriptional regulator
MAIKRMSSDSRRRQILDAAKQCFANFGFAGTTTKRVAAAASISEGLLFRHFPTKAALHAEILAEACETDPDLDRLLKLEPSTETLVTLVREMVGHFVAVKTMSNRDKAERLRLTASSHLDDGEFARLLFEKIGSLIAPLFEASIEQAVAAGDAERVGTEPINLFWFTHHLLHTVALTRLPEKSSLIYPEDDIFARQLSDFILRGLGLRPAVLNQYLDRPTTIRHPHDLVSESA